MTSIKINIGGASISVKIDPVSEATPLNPRVISDLGGFLAMMGKAEICSKSLEYSLCLAAFLEEVDSYLGDSRLADQLDDFVERTLPDTVKRDLETLGRRSRKTRRETR